MNAVLASSLDLAPALPKRKPRRVLPGFGLSLGYTLVYLSLLVLIPLSAVFLKTATLSWEQFWNIVTAPRVVASYKLSFGAALLAAVPSASVTPRIAETTMTGRAPPCDAMISAA